MSRCGAYQVSGEFSMVMAAAQKGWLDLDRAMLEILTAIQPRGRGFYSYLFRQASRAPARLRFRSVRR